MYHLTRRQFISLATISTGTVFLRQCNNKTAKLQAQTPSVYTSKDGLLEVNLEASESSWNFAGQNTKVMTYNGQIPAPHLETKPGDTIKINLTNSLSQTTNLHYHGLHISPTGKADNIFLEIKPRDSFTYEFTIPKNHPSGIFWYHPHVHDYSASQVFAGLAGLFVVRGDFDEIPEIKAAQEEFLVIQDFQSVSSITQPMLSHNGMMTGREGDLIAINGQIKPNFSIKKGGLLRLRILNSSSSRFYRLSLDKHPFHLIATDGYSLSQPITVTELLLTPGERAEVLIEGNQEAGQYALLNLPYNRGSAMDMMGNGMMMDHNMMRNGMRMDHSMMGNNISQNTPQVASAIATLTYQDTINPLPLPSKLINIPSLAKPEITRRFELKHDMIPGQGMTFSINDQVFDHQRIDTQVKLNTVEDWEIINSGVIDHPFHVHINHFQVISRNGQPESNVVFKDTIIVPKKEKVIIRVSFRDFTGKTTYHCHILDHEDLGMMGSLLIT